MKGLVIDDGASRPYIGEGWNGFARHVEKDVIARERRLTMDS